MRPALLDPSGFHGAITGRILLRRRGMVAWAHARDATPVTPPRSLGAAARGLEPSDFTSELVQLMAGLILTHHKESCDA